MIRSSHRAGGGLGASQRLRAGLGLLAAAGLAATLTACSAGQEAQTAFVSPSIDGANGQVGAIALRAITIAYPPGGQYAGGKDARLDLTVVNTGAQDDELVEVRADAAERVSLATGPEASPTETPSASAATSSATSSATGTASATPGGSAPPSASATVSATVSATASATASATESATESASPTPEAPSRIPIPAGELVAFRGDGPVATLVGLTRALRSAEIVQITFVFANAGQVTIDVPVAVSLTEVSPAPTVDLDESAEPRGGG